MHFKCRLTSGMSRREKWHELCSSLCKGSDTIDCGLHRIVWRRVWMRFRVVPDKVCARRPLAVRQSTSPVSPPSFGMQNSRETTGCPARLRAQTRAAGPPDTSHSQIHETDHQDTGLSRWHQDQKKSECSRAAACHPLRASKPPTARLFVLHRFDVRRLRILIVPMSFRSRGCCAQMY